jgi:hypothetical protein
MGLVNVGAFISAIISARKPMAMVIFCSSLTIVITRIIFASFDMERGHAI